MGFWGLSVTETHEWDPLGTVPVGLMPGESRSHLSTAGILGMQRSLPPAGNLEEVVDKVIETRQRT